MVIGYQMNFTKYVLRKYWTKLTKRHKKAATEKFKVKMKIKRIFCMLNLEVLLQQEEFLKRRQKGF